MGAETSPLELCSSLQELVERMDELLRLVHDRPYEHAIANRCENAANDQLGWLHEAYQSAASVNQLASEGSYRLAIEHLAACTGPLEHVMGDYYNRLKSYEWLDDLRSLSREHPADWSGWVESILATLDQCDPLTVSRAITHCWQDFAALGLAASSRSVQEIRPVPTGR